MLSKSDALVVLTLPGWAESSGVQSEIFFAEERDIPISYQTPNQNDDTNSTSSI